MVEAAPPTLLTPLIVPLGDQALLVRFGTTLSDAANLATIAFAGRLRKQLPAGVTEIDPNLVSVLLKFDPQRISGDALAGELRLLLSSCGDQAIGEPSRTHRIGISFGGLEGPDLDEVAASLKLTPEAFIAAHNAAPLRVLTTGFAPGFVYIGFHPESLRLPRRSEVRPPVPAGTVLFAAGQTAITATSIPTGWHIIGRTGFRNFDAHATPPTTLCEGDEIVFEAIPG